MKIITGLEGIYWDYNDTGGIIKDVFIQDLNEYVTHNQINDGSDHSLKEERRKLIL